MFMNKKNFFLFFVLLNISFISCNENKTSIFDKMFTGIPDNPLESEFNKDYEVEKINKNDINFPSYAARYGCEEIYIIKNQSIIITYWNINGKNQIQNIVINGKNTNHPFSKFFGRKTDEVLKLYPKDLNYEISKNELRYDSHDWLYFIQFKIENEKINKIIIGRNL